MRLDTDPYLGRYAARVTGIAASEIRALFSVMSRPEFISLAGGAPAVGELDLETIGDLTSALVQDHGSTALQYGGGQGRPECREALVEVMHEEGVPAHVDDLVVTVGGQQGLELVAKCFIDPGDVVVAEGPTYVGALGAMSSHQADVRHVPLDADGMQVELLPDLLDRLAAEGRGAKYVYVIPNHQNPGGVTLSVERRHRLVEIARERDLLVVEDNPYGLIDFEGVARPSLLELAPERVLYVSTMSKTFAPGVRVGWVAAPSGVRDKLVLLREATDLCPSNLTQMIVERYLGATPWRRQVKHFRELYRERARTMLDALAEHAPDGVTWTDPTGGLFLWLTLPPGIDSGALLAKAIQRRVAYVPGRGFFADGQGGRHLRLNYSFAEPDQIREGVQRIGELLHEELELVRAVYGTQDPPTSSTT